MSEAPKRTPRPVKSDRDARSFPLSPTDGFVLSRVDGALDEEDLAESIGLPQEMVQASLAKLETMGLITFDGAPPAPAQSGGMAAASRASSVHFRAATAPSASSVTARSPTPPPTAAPQMTTPPQPTRYSSAPRALSSQTHAAANQANQAKANQANQASQASATIPEHSRVPINPLGATVPQHSRVPERTGSSSTVARAPLNRTPPAAPVAPVVPLTAAEEASLVEDIDLDPDLRKRFLDAYRDLDQRDHYALLGVDEGADRRVIKRAYFELAAAFHPDRYFRKRLGTFKVRMEAVFTRLTIAHDTLAGKESRGDYDAYLSEQRISRAIEEHLANGLAQAKQAEAIVERLVLAEDPHAPPPPAPVMTSSPQVDLAARRDALARRLLGGQGARPQPAAGTAKPGAGGLKNTPAAPMHAADAVDALRRRYEDRMHRAKAREALKFASQAEAALASGDSVAAANAFRIAANLDTKDAELERKAAEARIKADALLSETYMRQGRYEETQGQWPEAARSWSRVCKVAPNNPIAHERAANAAVKASGDLHAGVRFGQRACELEPKNALFRITLATCYSAAGMALNARRELDTAAQLAPQDGTIQSMIKRVGQPA